MQEKTKNVLLAVLIVGLVSMTVAYAALSTTLTISSSAKVSPSTWSIKIDNWTQDTTVTNLNGGTSEATVTAPTITDETISGLVVTFKKPGDVARFTFDLVNDGGIDAKLDSVTIGTAAANSGVTNEVKCGTPTKVVPVPSSTNNSMDLVKTTGTIPCEMVVSYNKDYTASDMPETETTVSISNTVFSYKQK